MFIDWKTNRSWKSYFIVSDIGKNVDSITIKYRF